MSVSISLKTQKSIFALGAGIVTAVVGLLMISTTANGLGRVAPDPSDDTTNGRYWYVVSATPYVTIRSMESKAMFNTRNGHTLTIEHADICPNGSDENAGAQGGGAHTRYDIYRLSSDGTTKGALITTVYGRKDMSGGCGNRTVNIPNNTLPAIPNLYDGGDKYGIVVRATHIGAYNTQNGFKLRVDSGTIGMGTTNDTRDTGIQAGGANTYDRINIPLRTPCSVRSGSIWRSISIYDPDNGQAGVQPQNFRVRVLHNGNPLPASRYNPGARWSGNAASGYIPGSRSNEDYFLNVNWRAGEKYVIQLLNVYGNNTLQVGIPFDSAPYNFDCASTPTGRIISVECTNSGGQRIRFTSDDSDGPTEARIRIGSNTSPKYTGTWMPDGTQTITVPNNTGGMNFSSGTWTVRLDVKDRRPGGGYTAASPILNVDTASTDRCPPPVTFERYVNVRAVVDPPVDPHIEPTETTNFVGRVNVSNFPATNQWGYDEIASRAMPQEVPPTGTAWSYPSDNERLGRSDAQKDGCYQRRADGTCRSWYWTCDGNRVGTGSTAPTCPVRYKHTCDGGNVWRNYNSTGTCNDKTRWVCPAPNGSVHYRLTANGPPNCNVYRCQYAGAPNYITNDPDKSQCERRCNNGRGARPPLYSQGDYNCYQQPRFTLRCYWDGGDRMDVTVTANGDYCVRNKAKQGVKIGVNICAEYSTSNPLNTGGWSPNPPAPGYGSTDGGNSFRQIRDWGWNVTSPDEKCVRVVAKPTFKVQGGDVAVGGPFANSGICGASPAASIVGWPHTPAYDASGVELAGFASQDIFGFSTARINTNLALAPRSLAFANTPMSWSERFGGSFGPMPCIADHNGAKPTGLPGLNLSTMNSPGVDGAYQATTNTIPNSPTIDNGRQITVYVNGDVYINGTGIRYNRTGWVTTADIPAFKLVAFGGNIYIDSGVTELDGIYVAQPNGGAGGHIYTCTSGGVPVAGTSYYGANPGQGCRTPLTVNGTFIARQVHLGRSEGTAIFGETSEEFNYLPELWLGKWPQDNSSSKVKYDAIISLPPVL